MKIYVNSVRGMDDAITSMFMSKPGSWNRSLQEDIYRTVHMSTDHLGHYLGDRFDDFAEDIPGSKYNEERKKIREKEKEFYSEYYNKYNGWMTKLLKWGKMHVTMLRFIDICITVEGLHRAGQDDLDSHAKRMDNRIIRNSTRDKTSLFGSRVSEWYENKIIPTDVALAYLGINTPDEIEYNGIKYVRADNGYIIKGMENNPDIRRGLFHLALPSNCIFKVNLTEFAHIYKLRKEGSHAHPELRLAIECICDDLLSFYPGFTRDLLNEIDN